MNSIKNELKKYKVEIVFISLGDLESAKIFLNLYGNPGGEFYISTDFIKGDINGQVCCSYK